MNWVIQATDPFEADVARQFDWYFDEADEDVAWRFKFSVEHTLVKLSEQPDLGRVRHFRHPKLQGLRSFRVEPPFNKILIFYRIESDFLQMARLMHGARNLPRRLLKPSRSD